MEKLAPLAVAGPFLIAALFAISMPLSRRRDDIVSIVTASAGVVFVGAMLIDVLSHDVPVVTWVGGWQPRAGVALGISMAFDPLSTSLALLAAVLVCAAFLFAWRYFETPGPIFHALVLVFGGAMAGFCLSGDLFNLFVFFELMSVTAYALTAYRSEESGPLQGALTFAVSNTVGAVFILFGIALLYARTGALNLAQIGVALVPRARRRAGGGGVRVPVHRVHGQGGGGAVPLLARRRLRGGAHAGLRDLLGRDERPGHLRDRPGLLDHVRRAVPRPPGDAAARLPPLRRRDRAVGSGAVPGPAPPQAPARLRDHQPDRDGADRGGPVQHRGHRRRGAAHRRRRAAARGAVRGHRGRHPPHRQRQRAAALPPRAPGAEDAGGDLLRRRARAGRAAVPGRVLGQAGARARGHRRRPRLDHRRLRRRGDPDRGCGAARGRPRLPRLGRAGRRTTRSRSGAQPAARASATTTRPRPPARPTTHRR